VPVIDLDAPAGSAGLGYRARIALTVATVVVVVAVAATGWLIATARGTEVRFEAESGSGTAMLINWNVGIEHIGRERGDALRTPWSRTVTAEDLRGTAVLAVRSTDTDPVTCRIVVDGRTVAELTQDRAAGCIFALKGLAK
jgi:hypothetical protein